MPFQMEWLIENRVIFHRISGKRQADEQAEMNRKAQLFLNEAQTPLHFIVDIQSLEKELNSVQNVFRDVKHLNLTNLGWVVIISDNRVFQFVATTVLSLLGKSQCKAVSSLNEALLFLKSKDASLEFPKLSNSEAHSA